MQLTLDTERNYATVLEEHDLDRLVERIREKGAFVLDLETSTREFHARQDIVAFSIGLGEGEAGYVPMLPHPAPRRRDADRDRGRAGKARAGDRGEDVKILVTT